MEKEYALIVNGKVVGTGDIFIMERLIDSCLAKFGLSGEYNAHFEIIERKILIERLANEAMDKYHDALKRLDD